MTIAHTPAPWRVEPDRMHFDSMTTVIAGTPTNPAAASLSRLIVKVDGFSPLAEREASARVMAAAPAMLAALEKVEDIIFGNGAPLGSDRYFEIRGLLRAAIVAAKGEGA